MRTCMCMCLYSMRMRTVSGVRCPVSVVRCPVYAYVLVWLNPQMDQSTMVINKSSDVSCSLSKLVHLLSASFPPCGTRRPAFVLGFLRDPDMRIPSGSWS